MNVGADGVLVHVDARVFELSTDRLYLSIVLSNASGRWSCRCLNAPQFADQEALHDRWPVVALLQSFHKALVVGRSVLVAQGDVLGWTLQKSFEKPRF